MKKINIIEAAMKHYQIILSMIVVMMALGIFGILNMPRREFPEFTIRQGLVVGIYPGATSSEVEERLTTKVEDYLFGFEEVNKSKTYSHSKEGVMIVFVTLNDNVKNADKFWSKLRLGLKELKPQLPAGVVDLFGTNNFGDTSALLITISSNKKNYRQLADVMKDLEVEIRKVKSVSKIKLYGTQKEKIYIYLKPEKLTQFNIKPSTILGVFKTQNALNYSGNLDNGKLAIPIHLPPRFSSIKDLENQIIYSDPKGNIIRLKDVAQIEEHFEKPSNLIHNNGNNALVLSLEMQKGNNIVQFGKDIHKILAKFSKTTDKDVKINIISNLPEVVHHAISHFLLEFLIAIIAVIIVTMILLPFRVASVAAISIPVTILITLGIMLLTHIQLHIVSLAALLTVLGMVVDNAIVVIDEHIELLDQGETPWNAAWKSATELFSPIFTATLAIILAFFPLMLFLHGMAGYFVGSFPLTIGIALTISMLVALFLVPFINYLFIKQGLHKKSEKQKRSILDLFQNLYNKTISFTFNYPKTTIIASILSVIIGFLFFSNVDQKLFPQIERKQFAIEVYLPEGSPLSKTENIIDSLETVLKKEPKITNIASFIGNGSPRFIALYTPHLPSKNYGQLLINTTSDQATIDILKKYSKTYTNAFPQAHIKWKQLALETYRAPIEVRIASNNIKNLKKIGKEVLGILKKNKKIQWARSNWEQMQPIISVNLNKNKANKLGYAKSIVSTSLLVSQEGVPITTIWEKDYPISVLLTKEKNDINSINYLKNQNVTSPLTLQSLPLRTISKLKPEWEEGTIVRRNGVRTLTIMGDVKRGVIPSKVFSVLSPKINKIKLPKGVNITYGGDREASIYNYVPMAKSMFVSIILIFFIILLEFKTIRKTLLIISTMPLSIFGAGLGLFLLHYPFSFTSFIGIIGLMGIVVRNGIILVDYANQLVTTKGLSYKEAGLAAGKRRMRPIFLTSMAAAIGVIPMILSRSPLWGPLGTVICFGLIFGMILTLLTLPVYYWKFGSKEHKTIVE